MSATEGMQSLAIDVLANYLPAPIEKALRGSYDLSLLRQHIDCLKASQIVQENAQKPKERSGDKKDSAALKGAKKKAPVVSRGVKELEKVSKRGMSKLTTFFAKKAA
jgi:ribonuclease H2 subunit B